MIVACVLAACAVLLWLLSLKRRDASIADPFWGTGFVLVAGVGLLAPGGDPGRRALVAGLVALWGLRLTAYLVWRHRGRGEDPRYAKMRADGGAGWWWKSLFVVFGLQCALIALVSLPVQAALAAPVPLGWLDAVGSALVLVGVAFEAAGDFQLARFKADPANRGAIMDRGLWRYTRHPNYFGDFLVWWGLYALAIPAGGAWTAIGPLAMSVLLLRVSGVALTESLMADRPGYAAYVRRTNAFFPGPPRT